MKERIRRVRERDRNAYRRNFADNGRADIDSDGQLGLRDSPGRICTRLRAAPPSCPHRDRNASFLSPHGQIRVSFLSLLFSPPPAGSHRLPQSWLSHFLNYFSTSRLQGYQRERERERVGEKGMLIRSREFVCHVHSPARIYRGRQYDDGNGGGYEDAGGRRRNKEMGDTFLGPGYSRLCSSSRLTPSAMGPLKRELSPRFIR